MEVCPSDVILLSCHHICRTSVAGWQRSAHSLWGQDATSAFAPAMCSGGVSGVSDASNWLNAGLSCMFLRAEYYYDTGDSRAPLINAHL